MITKHLLGACAKSARDPVDADPFMALHGRFHERQGRLTDHDTPSSDSRIKLPSQVRVPGKTAARVPCLPQCYCIHHFVSQVAQAGAHWPWRRRRTVPLVRCTRRAGSASVPREISSWS